MEYKDELIIPDAIQVQKSGTHGYGVFAVRDIQEGEVIEQCYGLSGRYFNTDSVLKNYVFKHTTIKNMSVLLTGYGMIYNTVLDATKSHSRGGDYDRLNVRYWHLPEMNLFVFQTTKDVKEGEELLVSYGNAADVTKGIKRGIKEQNEGQGWEEVDRSFPDAEI